MKVLVRSRVLRLHPSFFTEAKVHRWYGTMTALATRVAVRNALELPKMLVAAAQPYQTLAGPALSVDFLYQPQLLPFQSHPMLRTSCTPRAYPSPDHSASAAVYYHVLLHTLAEFAETPRPVRSSAVKILHAPIEDFWRSVGTLNTMYGSHLPAAMNPGVEEVRRRGHPSMGAVELSRPAHRPELDVRLTLYDSQHRPMSTLCLTGPGSSTAMDPQASTAAPHTAPLRRTPLPLLPPPTSPEGFRSAGTGGEASHGTNTNVHVPLLSNVGESVAIFGGLYGERMVLRDGGIALRACYRWTDLIPTPDADEEGPSAGTHEEMPPWVLLRCVGEVGQELVRGHPAASPSSVSHLASYHYVQSGDAIFNEPLDVVVAPPRHHTHFRVPRWRHVVGLPIQPEGPCTILRLEVRQRGSLVLSGTFFFSMATPTN